MPEVPQQVSTPAAPVAAPESKPEAKPVPQSSIAAELSRVFDQKKAESDAKASGRPAAVSPGQGTPPPESKSRDEAGRFASAKAPDQKPDAKVEAKADAKDAKPDAKPEAKVDPKAAEAKAADEKAAADKAERAKGLQPHPRWKPEVQERFKKLAEASPEDAEFVLGREKEIEQLVTKATQAAKDAGAKFKGLDDILAPGRQARSMQGIDDATFMRSLVAASDFLAKSPRDGIKMLAEQYGIDLKEIADGKAADVQDSPVVRQLQTQVKQLTDFIASQNQGAQRNAVHGALQSIEAFKQEKDEQGQLRYPHFDEVVDDIAIVVARQKEAGQQPDLKAAYQVAIRLNDSVWTKTQAAKSEAERKQREEEEVRRVQEAKRAGFSASGSGAIGDSVGGTIAEELRRQIDKAYSR